MRSTTVPSTRNSKKSQPDSELTYHQNEMVPAPLTVVCSQLDWLWLIDPLRMAPVPSCVCDVCAYHDADPPLVNVKDVVFNAPSHVIRHTA